MIDRVDLLGYLASNAGMRDEATGMVSVPLASAAAYYLPETVPEECSRPLTLALWESGHDLVIMDGVGLRQDLVAGAQIYAAGRLRRRIHDMEGEISCRSEVVCAAADILVLRGSDGGRPKGKLAGRFWSALTSWVSDIGSSR